MNDAPLSMPSVTLILGGARSGKSVYAEGLLAGYGQRLYVATAEAGDAEMAERIRLHRDRRGEDWQTIEEPLELATTLAAEARADRPVLVDCLTLWLANILAAGRDAETETQALAVALHGLAGPVVLVSNEVGSGIVPDKSLARQFMDCAGRLNQVVAGSAHRVLLITAGLATTLKDLKP
jgi:adenosylcobinamide kinase/adenosylcobinamide-phosphate guanylyltransferase